jgi:hypothetical protein
MIKELRICMDIRYYAAWYKKWNEYYGEEKVASAILHADKSGYHTVVDMFGNSDDTTNAIREAKVHVNIGESKVNHCATCYRIIGHFLFSDGLLQEEWCNSCDDWTLQAITKNRPTAEELTKKRTMYLWQCSMCSTHKRAKKLKPRWYLYE